MTQGKKKQPRYDDEDISFISPEAQSKWSKFQKLGFINGKHMIWAYFAKWSFEELFNKVGLFNFAVFAQLHILNL